MPDNSNQLPADRDAILQQQESYRSRLVDSLQETRALLRIEGLVRTTGLDSGEKPSPEQR